MATVIEISDMRAGYIEVIQRVIAEGRSIAPRGEETLEVIAPTIVLTNPRASLPLGIGRKLNLRIAAIEACQLIAGRAFPKLVLAASPNFAVYAEEDQTFHGNYGERAANQLRSIYRKLTEDPATRQAVMTLWSPVHDNLFGKKDYPCTVGFQFLLRDGKLDMITTMRSNDVWLGMAYDVFQFTQLQLSLARMLKVSPGQYVHQPGSLHIYARDVEKAKELAVGEHVTILPRGIGRSDATYDLEGRDRALAILNGDELQYPTISEVWYKVQIDQLRAKVDGEGQK